MNKHTPGPFLTSCPHGGTIYVEARLRGSTIQEVAAVGPTETPEQQRANANLFAAAPDLLEALEDLKRELVLSDVNLDYIESHFRPWLNKAESAIAKARDYLFSPMPGISKARGES